MASCPTLPAAPAAPPAAPARAGTAPTPQFTAAVDAFRGFVCLSLAGMHFYGAVQAPFLAAVGPGLDWAVANLRLGSESFFVLAGYFLARGFRARDWRSLSLRKFYLRRVLRLAVPYWAAVALGMAGLYLRAATTGMPQPSQGWRDALATALFVHDLAGATPPALVMWFMAPLFQAYLLWGLAFWALQRWRPAPRPEARREQAMVALVVLLSAASLLVVASRAELRYRWFLAGQGAYIGLGCLVHWAGRPGAARGLLAALTAALLVVAVAVGDSRPVAACAAALVLWRLSRHPQPRWAGWRALVPLAVVGQYSFSVYLTHMYVGPRVLHAGLRLGWAGSVSQAALLLLAALAASLAAAWLFHRAVEAPLARLARGVSYRD
jgi:peptidoglycan/LPS O-acetylase OafA/YrhL